MPRLAAEYGMSKATVGAWLSAALAAENKLLKAENLAKTMENDLLKKVRELESGWD